MRNGLVCLVFLQSRLSSIVEFISLITWKYIFYTYTPTLTLIHREHNLVNFAFRSRNIFICRYVYYALHSQHRRIFFFSFFRSFFVYGFNFVSVAVAAVNVIILSTCLFPFLFYWHNAQELAIFTIFVTFHCRVCAFLFDFRSFLLFWFWFRSVVLLLRSEFPWNSAHIETMCSFQHTTQTASTSNKLNRATQSLAYGMLCFSLAPGILDAPG